MITFIVLILLGMVAAMFGSLLGLGGGIIIVPGLLLLSPYIMEQPLTAAEAVGTSLTVLIFIGLSSTLTLIKQKRIDFQGAGLFFMTSGPATMIGASMTGSLSSSLFDIFFGIFMFLMALLLWTKNRLNPVEHTWKYQRTYTDKEGNTFKYGFSLIPVLVLGFFVGFMSGLFGIGGGSLFIPAMMLLFQFPPHIATATSMFVILLSSSLGTITKIYLGEVHFLSVAAIAPGALIGGWLGAKVSGKLNSNKLMSALLITFLFLAIRMIYIGLTN